MANLKHTDPPYIQMFVESIRGAGYVLDFSDANFGSFIESVSGLNIDNDKYFKCNLFPQSLCHRAPDRGKPHAHLQPF